MESSIVISLGGSIISDDPLDIQFIRKFSRMIGELNVSRIGIVVGGGRIARSYISALRKEKVDEFYLDRVGMLATRINALAVSTLIEGACPVIPETFDHATELLSKYRIVVMGGTGPGYTTDTVSTLFAESIGCNKVINATSVDGVYDSDPKKEKNAKKINFLSYDEAISLASNATIGAGSNVFMDMVSLTIAKRSGIRIFVVDGRDLDQVSSAINEGKCSGSVIG